MSAGWDQAGAGVLRLPSGRLVRGRGLRNPLPVGELPTYGVYLLGHQPPEFSWESRWLVWPDFWLPKDRADARLVLAELLDRATSDRVDSRSHPECVR